MANVGAEVGQFRGTHVAADMLEVVAEQLASWGGPATVAVFLRRQDELAVRAAIGQYADRFRASRWSLVFEMHRPRTAHDRLYPANLLRQVSALAAKSGDVVLSLDPGFFPSRGFREDLRGDYGTAVRELFAQRNVLMLSAFGWFSKRRRGWVWWQ